MRKVYIHIMALLWFATNQSFAVPIIADHQCTDINLIPVAAIQAAKQTLHIGYGHTSHGSQITSGMQGLVDFMNNKGYPHNLFQWNHTGSGGALHLYQGDGYGEGDLDHDAGYYPNWVQETRDYLGAPNVSGRGSAHPEMNVIMWSWCGQLSWYSSNEVQTQYLDEMNALETDYPSLIFVYMTGHSDGSGLDGTLHKNNQKIRDYCIANNKVLFDFYDIECYDPDGIYYGDKHVSDDCSYDGGNWALEWQSRHQRGVDWYDCESAHSQPLNANLKAYAIWWLWARCAGWDGVATGAVEKNNDTFSPSTFTLYANFPNPFNSRTNIRYTLHRSATVALAVFDSHGRCVFSSPAALENAGEHVYNMNMHNLPSGLYYYQLTVDNDSETRRLVLLR